MSLVCVEYQGSQVNIGSGYGLAEQMNIGSGYGLLQQDVTLVLSQGWQRSLSLYDITRD